MAGNATPAVGFNQFCPVAVALDAIGDRWSLLLLRDMLWAGPQSRQGLIERNPGLTDTELSDATDRLTAYGIVHQLEEPKARYALTERGEGIAPVISALFDFGLPMLVDVTINDWMLAYALADCSRRKRLDLLEIAQRSIVRMTIDDANLSVEISPGLLRVVEGHTPDATVAMSGSALAALIGGSASADELRADGRIRAEGDPDALETLLTLLPTIY
ncbi:MAG: winged helix-turn-helix transcriptional regulator [Acidimicrobiales bacterium]